MMLVDISGARLALDMEGAASEVLGYANSLFYDDTVAVALRQQYNKLNSDTTDIFSPIMVALRDSNQMGVMVDWMNAASGIIVGVFLVIAMIVLWNMGLMNGLRRYGEIGMRLAIGESKGQVYRSMIMESVIIGFIGTVFGTAMGTRPYLLYARSGLGLFSSDGKPRLIRIYFSECFLCSGNPQTLLYRFYTWRPSDCIGNNACRPRHLQTGNGSVV